MIIDNYENYDIYDNCDNYWQQDNDKDKTGTCDIWDTDNNSDNWEPESMTIFVIWQSIVTLDSIRNSCDVYNHTCQLVKSVMMIIVVSLFNRIQLDSIGEERRGRVWHDAAIQVRHKCNTMMDAAIQPLVEYTKYNTSCNTSVTQVWKQRWVLHKNLHKAAIQAPVQRYTSCDSQQCNLQVVQCNKKYKKQWNTGRTVHRCKLHKHSKTKHIQQVGKLTVYKCKLHKFSKTWERTLYLFRVPPFLAHGANYLLIVEMQLFLYCDQIKYFEI